MMDNHIVNKFSRLFPSSFTSCQFRNIPDVVENSFIISKNSKFVHNNAVGVSSRTNSSIKTQESKSNKNTLLKSSSSNSGWFSSEGENDETEDAFFSLSSGYFSDSFRRKPDESCRKMYNQKSSEMGRCYSELSVNSVSRVGSNLGESKWVKSRNGTSKTEQNRGKVSRTLRETGGTSRKKYGSEMSHCSATLSRTNGRVGSNLDESKWVKSINGLDFASAKTEQNRGKTSRTARKTANQKDSEMSPSSSALWRTNERVNSNLDESKWVKSINELDFTTSKTEQNRGKAESKWVKSINELDFASSNTEQNRGKPIRTARKTANQNDSEMSHSSSELSMINEQVNSNLDESKRVKSINELDFTISKTEQNRVNTSRKTPPRSSRRTLRKTTPVEKFDYYSDLTSNTRRKTTKCRRKIKKSSSTSSDEMGRIKIVIEGRIEESIAVEKNTNDPHNDFRTSMLEMIVEKQIFGLKDLQRLLHCFLSLNSPSFHKIIFEVFAEIFETLFH